LIWWNWQNIPFRPLSNWAFPLVFVGFAILAGLWPFHTWAPTGHVAAPTAGFHAAGRGGDEAGRLRRVARRDDAFSRRACAPGRMKSPAGGDRHCLWRLVALVQKDFKFVIGYSSVSHMGFVLLGLDDA
jgi:NADH-quinone oxidoreductase subunit M